MKHLETWSIIGTVLAVAVAFGGAGWKVVHGIEQRLDLLTAQQSELSRNITTLSERVTRVEERVTSMETRFEERFTGLEKRVGAVEGKVDRLQEDLVELQEEFAEWRGEMRTRLQSGGVPDKQESPSDGTVVTPAPS